jgi:hypothetical protein
MQRTLKLTLMFAFIALIGIGCSQGNDPVNSATTQTTVDHPMWAGKLSTPAGATLVSATLSVYCVSPENGTVTVHRITSPWAEMGVTWANFAGAYDPAAEASFPSNAVGWHSVDVTALVQAWMDDTYDNYGFLLRQPDAYVSLFNSSEGVDVNLHPKLEICYTTDGGDVCETIQRGTMGYVWDASIWEMNVNENLGASLYLQAGLLSELEKQALIRFDMDDRPCDGALGDTVWFDDNKNGLQDEGEAGVPDVTVNLYTCDDVLVATTTTNADGFYWFGNLEPGRYYVEFIKPEGYVFTMKDAGDDALDSDADEITGITDCFSLECEENPTIDAGIYMPVWEGCSLTIGFWKTHGGFGPQADVVSQYLPISLGSFNVSNGTIAHDVLVMKTYGEPSNGITKLMAQLLGTKLNAANGADTGAVDAAIASADAFLSTHTYMDWDSLSTSEKKMVNNLMSTFDDYNNGLIGPGHCD